MAQIAALTKYVASALLEAFETGLYSVELINAAHLEENMRCKILKEGESMQQWVTAFCESVLETAVAFDRLHACAGNEEKLLKLEDWMEKQMIKNEGFLFMQLAESKQNMPFWLCTTTSDAAFIKEGISFVRASV
eukprot:3932605-Rhodomonas_salina.1